MSKQLQNMLKPCPFCGAKAQLKIKRGKVKIRVGSHTAGTSERFLRCSKCHARTPAKAKLDNLVALWNSGEVYKLQA